MADTILLIQPPIEDFYLTKKRTIPYGLLSIAAHLKKAGFSVKLLDALATKKSRIIDFPEEMNYLCDFYGREDVSAFSLFHRYRQYGYSFQHMEKLIKEAAAFLVGISSLFTPYAGMALKTAKIAKTCLPACRVVVGGHHATTRPESVMACEAVDFVLRGEGEVSMPLLARTLATGRNNLKEIPGIVFRQEDGALHSSRPAFLPSLDALASPAIELMRKHYYQRNGKLSYVVVASRGCPLNCSYCSVGRHTGIKFRKRPISSIMEELSVAVFEYGARFIDFEDEALSFDRNWFRTLLHGIITEFGKNSLELRAMNGLYPPSLDLDTVVLMQKAGFRILNLSLGSSKKKQLKRFNRPDVVSAFEQALLLAKKVGMEAVGYIIVGAPDQNPMESVEDLLYLAQRRVLAGVSIFYPSPGSADFEMCRRLNLLPALPSLFRSSAFPISHATSRRDAVTLLRLARILNFMKSLIDHGLTIFEPIPFDARQLKNCRTQFEIDIILLQGFMYDGTVRGLTAAGGAYSHQVSSNLVRRFIKGLKNIKIQGCK